MSASDWFSTTRGQRFVENPSLALRACSQGVLGVSAFLVGSAAFKAVESAAQVTQPQGVSADAPSDWWAHWRKAVENDANLRAVLDAWPTLPAAVKAGIVAMVKAASGGDSIR